MKRNDEILKYLSDLMTEKEKLNFEKELSVSDDLRNELAEQKNVLHGINQLADIKEDSPYFQNLLPRVRTKLERKKKLSWMTRFAYIVPTATAIVLLVLNTGKFLPDKTQNKAALSAESEVIDNSGAEYLYNKFNLVSDTKVTEIGKKDTLTFEVGISDISNKESLKEIVKSRYANSFEDYLLASK